MAARTILYAVQIRETGTAALTAGITKIGQAAQKTQAQVVAMNDRARPGFKATGDELSNLSGGLFRVIAGLGFAGVAIDKLLSGNREWDRSTAALGKQFGSLRTQIADTFGPTAAGWLRNFSVGLAGIVGGLAAIPAVLDFVQTSLTNPAARKSTTTIRERGPDGQWRNVEMGSIDRGSPVEQMGAIMQKSIEQALEPLAKIFADPGLGGGGGGGTSLPNYAAAVTTIAGSAGTLTAQFLTTTDAMDALNRGSQASARSLTGWADKLDAVAVPGAGGGRSAMDFLRGDAPKGIAAAATISGLQPGAPGFAAIGGLMGPMGAALGSLADNFRAVPDILLGLGDQIVGVFEDLPGVLIDLIPMVITELIPGLVSGIAKAFAEAIADIFGGDAPLSTVDRIKGEGVRMNAAQQMFLDQQDGRSGSGRGNSGFAGSRTSDPGGRSGSSRSRGGVGNVTVNVTGSTDPEATARAVSRELRRLQGNFGVGLTLDPVR